MIPMRTSSVFKSRWMALIWSAGILWFAYDFAGGSDQSSNESAIADNGVQQAIASFSSIKEQ